MSRTYKMSDIDDVRELVIDLDENGKPLSGAKIPVSAILKINHGGTQKERTLQIEGSVAKYRMTDADFTEFGLTTMTARVHATFSDGSGAAIPTPPGLLTIIIMEANP
ncbi:MAG TPA: hypothetical protein VF773_10895 [Verrucomicrobiae bacterium]